MSKKELLKLYKKWENDNETELDFLDYVNSLNKTPEPKKDEDEISPKPKKDEDETDYKKLYEDLKLENDELNKKYNKDILKSDKNKNEERKTLDIKAV